MTNELKDRLSAVVANEPVPMIGKEGEQQKCAFRFEVAAKVEKQINTFISKVLKNQIFADTAIAFLDTTLFGTGKKGILLTMDAVYNTKGQYVLYKDIVNIKSKGEVSSVILIEDTNRNVCQFNTGISAAVAYAIRILEGIMSVLQDKSVPEQTKKAAVDNSDEDRQKALAELVVMLKIILQAKKETSETNIRVVEAEKQPVEEKNEEPVEVPQYAVQEELVLSQERAVPAQLQEWIDAGYGRYSVLDVFDEDVSVENILATGVLQEKTYDYFIDDEYYEVKIADAKWSDLFAIVCEQIACYTDDKSFDDLYQPEEMLCELFGIEYIVDDIFGFLEMEVAGVFEEFLCKLNDYLTVSDNMLAKCVLPTDITVKELTDLVAQIVLPAEKAFVDGESEFEDLVKERKYRQELEDRLYEAFDLYDEERFEEAHELFLDCAKQGHPRGQYQAGMMYYSGKGTEKNYKEALYWLEKAVNNNVKKAADPIALIYAKRYSEFFDVEKLRYWSHRARDMGTANGEALVDAYETLIAEMAEEKKRLDKAEEAYNAGRYEEAYDDYDFMAKYSMEALYRRGLMLLKGIGVDCNEMYGYTDLCKASAEGHPGATKALEDYGNMLEESDAFKKEAGRCASKFSFNAKVKEVENTQNKHIAYWIAQQYQESTVSGVKNSSSAKKWYERAAACGSGAAWYNLAIFYLRDGGKKNSQRFLELMEKSLRGGIAGAAIEMSKVYLDKNSGFYNVKKAEAVLRRGVKLLNADCMYEEGKLYQNYYEELGIDKSRAEFIASIQFQEAAQKGHEEARKQLNSRS